ncbi:MAG TPA: hypothetical protein VFK09_05495, partial [Gemmatimonadales bacterium]|nr:hypothetical protein [Gemmatimonadales bacterium]
MTPPGPRAATTHQRHLVGVWNPAYAVDAMEAHRRLLLDAIRAWRIGGGDLDDVHVWWGKVRSPNRQQRLPHLAEILALNDEIGNEDDRELHLYLTDYRSLYVAHVAEITERDVRREEPGRVPDYYRAGDLHFDCWFRLWDIRRLVNDDTLAVVQELKHLRNVHYGDRPVSLYGGMVDLPLVVWRADEVGYFDERLRDQVLEGLFWVEFDSEQGGLPALERDLRDNVVGEEAWSALDPSARAAVASAEREFRERRADASHDFTGVLVNLAKAYELHSALLLRRALARESPAARSVNVEGRSVDLVSGRPLSVGQLANALEHDGRLAQLLRGRLVGGNW